MRVSCIQQLVSNKKYMSRIFQTSNNTFEIVPKASSVKKKHKYFRNECNVTYQNHICIKIFSDYTLHVTGIKNISDISSVCNRLLERMVIHKECFGTNITDNTFQIINPKILLIRSHFRYPGKINLTKMHRLAKTAPNFNSEYTEIWDRFVKLGYQSPDMSIKYTVFASGSVLVSLNSQNPEKSLCECRRVFDDFMNTFYHGNVENMFDD